MNDKKIGSNSVIQIDSNGQQTFVPFVVVSTLNADSEKVVLGQISQKVSQLNDMLYTGCVISGQGIQQNILNDINMLATRLYNRGLYDRVIGFTNVYNKFISKCDYANIVQKRNLIFDINQHLLNYFNVLQSNQILKVGKTIDEVGGIAVRGNVVV